MFATNWFKARRCSASTCVEVRFDRDEVLVRDSKQNAMGETGETLQPIIRVTKRQWFDFLPAVLDVTEPSGAITIDTIYDGVMLRSGTVVLRFDTAEWDAFRAGVREGDFTPQPALT